MASEMMTDIALVAVVFLALLGLATAFAVVIHLGGWAMDIVADWWRRREIRKMNETRGRWQ